MADGARFVDTAWWKAYIFGGVAAWAGATIAVAASRPPGEDSLAVRLTAALGGAVYFAGIFLVTGRADTAPDRTEQVRRRLALAPATAADLAAERRGQAQLRRIRAVYTAVAAAGVAVMLSIVAVGSTGYAMVGIGVLAVLTLVFCGYFFHAWSVATRAAAAAVASLGLQLVAMPTYLRVPDLAGGSLSGFSVGAAVYRGERHGRRVHIVQDGHRAATLVGEPPPTDAGVAPGPIGPEAMAGLTGEPPSSWRGVSVLQGPTFAAVRRDGNGAGAWMFHDLLLAESLLPPP